MINYGIYMILNMRTNARYVGGTNRSLTARFAEHRCKLRHSSHACTRLQAAWNTDGEESFALCIVEANPPNVTKREQYWLDKFRAEGVELYNSSPSADSNVGVIMPDTAVKTAVQKRQITRAAWSPRRHAAFVNKCKSAWTAKRRAIQSAASKNAWKNNRSAMIRSRRNYGPYKFRSPSGELIVVVHLSDFCREHALDPSAMLKVFKGGYGRKSFKGWTKG